MRVVLHETPELYEQEYSLVRGTLITQGTTLQAWLAERGICRQLAYRALRGRSYGKKAIKLRARILREVLGEAA
jgi:hypothetical protein